jgi:hypothetical protein
VKQGKLGYYIGHHSHVQSAEAGEEVVIKPGERDRGCSCAGTRTALLPHAASACCVAGLARGVWGRVKCQSAHGKSV